MRQASLSGYGVDLYPGGPLSGYRTYDQQHTSTTSILDGRRGRRRTRRGAPRTRSGVAVDLAAPEMRSVIDEIGPTYGWHAPHSNEWWHVEYWG